MKFNKKAIFDLFTIRKKKNLLISVEKKLSTQLKTYLEDHELTGEKYKNIYVSIGTRERTEFDKELFQKEHPTINIDNYFVKKPFDVLNFTELKP